MQRGIDSFFKKVTPSGKQNGGASSANPVPKKRKAPVISSDEEEVVESPQVSKSRDHKKTRTETKSKKDSKKPSLAKLNVSPKKDLMRVDPAALFGGETVRVEARKPPKRAEIELEDADIDRSLLEIDLEESILGGKVKQVAKSECGEQHNNATKPTTPRQVEKSPIKIATTMKPVEIQASKIEDGDKVKPKAKKQTQEDKTPNKEKPKDIKTPKAQKKDHADLDSSVQSDEDRHERKRLAAILYQKYKNRSSCLNPGSKEVPQGKPNCLAGLTFLVTGVLESLERAEAEFIIKEYGGKVMTTVGKRLNYIIVGEDAGPKKLAQAEEFGTKILSEDGFFELIREKSDTQANKDEERPTTSAKSKTTSAKTTIPKKQKDAVEVKQEKIEPSPGKKRKIESLETKEQKEEMNNKHIKVKQDKKETVELPIKQELQADVKSDLKMEINDNMMTWVDKYKPTTVKEIVGQHGAASNVAKLMNWLSKWYINHDGKKKLQKPNPWAKNDDGSYYKAALLSGPPGIGKTTTATLVCKELGFDTVEFNASDTRSKRLLKEEVSELLSNKSLYGYFHGKAQAVTKKHVLIMDEVDGMAGNEDRGGIQELIALIKDSAVPIICMCNDRNHQKMRSLVNYCYDLRFIRPRLEQIKGRMMTICCRENYKLAPARIEEIIAATNNDIRQTINHIALLSAGKELNLPISDADTASGVEGKIAQKDLKIGPWEVVRKVFSVDEHKRMNFNEKSDLFFHDYSLAPLFVQQNYLQVSPAGPKSEVLQKVALTADALSLGDLADKRIRSNAAWSLLPTQAVFSSVMPGEYMCGHFTGQINFPGWLGKNSRGTKRSRLAQEIHDHTRLRTSGSRLSVRLDYAPFLLAAIVRPLKVNGVDGVPEALDVIKEYHLLREDIESLIELSSWPGQKSPMDAVDSRVKAALTRAYNKEVLAYSYSATAGIKKKKADANDESELLLADIEGEEGEPIVVMASDEENDADNLENDGLIKAKKRTAAAASSSTTKASGSKSKAAGAGKSKAATAKTKK